MSRCSFRGASLRHAAQFSQHVQLTSHNGVVWGVAFSPDSRALYVGIADATYSSLAHYRLAHDPRLDGDAADDAAGGDEARWDGDGGAGGGRAGEARGPWRPVVEGGLDAAARRARAARRRRCAGLSW